MRRISIVILIGLAITAVIYPTLAVAQNQNLSAAPRSGLTVSPAIFEMIMEPGEVKKQQFFVINTEDYPVPIQGTVQQLSPTEEIIDPSLSKNFDASSWVEISSPNHILKGKERRQLTATVSVPKGAEPGGHYATMIFEPLKPATPRQNSGTQSAAQVGILVFITIKGDAVTKVSFRDRIVSRLHTSRQVLFNVALANTGNIHVLPTSNVVVRNIFGGTKTKLPLKPRIVLPNTIKRFSAKWEKPAVLGIYSAQVVGSYGSAQAELVSDKQYFLVVRWLPLVFILLILSAVSMFVLKTYKRWPQAYKAFISRSSSNHK